MVAVGLQSVSISKLRREGAQLRQASNAAVRPYDDGDIAMLASWLPAELGMRRVAVSTAVLTLAFLASHAEAQQQPGPSAPQAVGQTQGPLGGWQAPSNNPGSGAGDMPGMWAPADSAQGMPKGPYGVELARRIADAHRFVEQVNRGKALTERDRRHVRDLMRDDFLAWSNQYDLPPTPYRAERDRWIVDVRAMTPEQWAKHRLDWLETEREWIISHGG
jgi:hypothetical protein